MMWTRNALLAGLLMFFASCDCSKEPEQTPGLYLESVSHVVTEPSIIVLGTIQDAGSPHIGCDRACCKDLHRHPDPDRKVVSLGIVDPDAQQRFIIDATPDFPAQLDLLQQYAGFGSSTDIDGVFLTHAHIGHYTGLMYLGREALGASKTPVYAMPRMKQFLEENGPWSQLVQLENIELNELADGVTVRGGAAITVTPFRVPHRNEFSETVGYRIAGPSKSALFIPDIDKWEKWQTPIVEAIPEVDYAFVDGSFFDSEELGYRDMTEIPHPSIRETMSVLDHLPAVEKAKVYFIHFNHTNPVINLQSEQYALVIAEGYNIAAIYDVYPL